MGYGDVIISTVSMDVATTPCCRLGVESISINWCQLSLQLIDGESFLVICVALGAAVSRHGRTRVILRLHCALFTHTMASLHLT